MSVKQTGLILESPKPLDWIAGEETGISDAIRMPSGNWQNYLPTYEKQKLYNYDTKSCVTFSALNSVETQIRYLRSTKQLSPEAEQYLTNFGFIDEQGNFNASDRFIAILSGTTQNGNSLTNVWNAIRKYGLLPEKDLPFGGETWSDYMGAPITNEMLAKAKVFLEFFTVAYDWVFFAYGQLDQDSTAKIDSVLKTAPIQVGIPYPAYHAVMSYARPAALDYLDTYEPFLKETTEVNFGVRGYISVQTAPETYTMPVYQFTKDIEPGTKSDEVKTLQQALRAIGLFSCLPTGYWGPITTQAVKNFQVKNGLPPVGRLGPQTRAILNKLTV
jgi:hypothetical protein